MTGSAPAMGRTRSRAARVPTGSGAGWGADRLFGGAGDDRLWGGVGNDLSWGEDGNDVIGGGRGNDRQSGGAGQRPDLCRAGNDESWGEDGDDTLWAMARKDVQGPNDIAGDVLHGGPGNDTFRVRDGEQDTVDCGPGVDTVYADFKDVLANPGECEVVNRARRAKKGEDQRGEPGTGRHAEPARIVRSGEG